MPQPGFTTDQGWFQQLFESSPDPTWIIDGNRFVACNEAAIRTLGYSSREEFLHVHPSNISPSRQPDGEDSYAKAERMMALAQDKGLHRFEWMHTRADGTDFLAEVTLSSVSLDDRKVIYCVWRDITERKTIEEKLRRQNDMLSAIIDNFPGGVSVFDADLRLTAYNDKFSQMLDLPDVLIEKPGLCFEDFLRYNVARGDYGPGDPEQQVDGMLARVRDFQPHTFERVRPNGTALEIRGMPLPDGGFVTLYMDITARKHAEDEIRNLAFYDTLTQLPNRRLLSDRLSQFMAASKRGGRHGALMFLDLDNFKPLNDEHGHAVGDLLLIEAAARLRNCVRGIDTVARFGGDEFVVLLSELNPGIDASRTQAEIVAEKIRSMLAEPYHLTVKREGQVAACIEHHCTVSIGVSLFLNHDSSQDDILRWADKAMYEAKVAGRNSIRFYAG